MHEIIVKVETSGNLGTRGIRFLAQRNDLRFELRAMGSAFAFRFIWEMVSHDSVHLVLMDAINSGIYVLAIGELPGRLLRKKVFTTSMR